MPSSTLPPPPPATRADVDPRSRHRLQRPLTLLLVAVSVGVGLAIVVGAAVGLLVFAASAGTCSPDDGWCELGAVLTGLVTGGAAAVAAYLATGAAVVCRYRPRGRRAPHITAVVGVPPAALIVLTLLGQLSSG
jgi:hypothetical protein